MINKVVLVGRLTKDPDVRYTQTQTPIVNFTIAVNRQYTNKTTGEKETDFIPVVVFRGQAENVSKFVRKGSLVGVEGRIQTRNYDDNNGVRKYVTEVVADNVVFLEPKGAGDQIREAYEPQEKEEVDESVFDKYDDVTFSDNDIPF